MTDGTVDRSVPQIKRCLADGGEPLGLKNRSHLFTLHTLQLDPDSDAAPQRSEIACSAPFQPAKQLRRRQQDDGYTFLALLSRDPERESMSGQNRAIQQNSAPRINNF